MTSVRNPSDLFTMLDALGSVYPDLRFGQLVEMLASLASETAPEPIEDIPDHRLLHAATGHFGKRQALVGNAAARHSHTEATRARLIDVLRELKRRKPSEPIGSLVTSLASSASVSLYDVEDEALISAGESSLAAL